MPTVQINEERVALPDGATVLDAVAHTTGRDLTEAGTPTDGGRLGVAVAAAGEVLPRGQWSRTALSEGDELEIVTAVQGG
ncbi:sulfur carrier protein ThiS [Nesterenkonia alba]|uniref:sulfur carrier protein ThiS n=1 Tax=Nesterenkonia alba TaxID=515814 RepID=UPI0003B66815|nr:sulfur carrier protein ThiS [Nesterenkonia alba]